MNRDLPSTMRRYVAVYADPPWHYHDRHAGYGGAKDHYETLSLEAIRQLQIPAAEHAACFLWSTFPLLPDALGVLQAWGFQYKTTAFTWVKTTKDGAGLMTGLGAWTRSNAEICLLGTRGRPRVLSHRVHSVVLAPRGRHSEKPDEVRDRITALLGAVPRIELFARKRVPGWDAWGNEVRSTTHIAGSPTAMTSGRRERRCSTGS